MITAITKRNYTPEDLLRMPDGDRYELVNGELVEHTMSTWANFVAGELHGRLREFSRTHKLGWVLPEGTSYQCFQDDPAKVRRADVSFIRADRLTLAEAQGKGHALVVPDLVAEVLSPNDLVYIVDQKIQEYLAADVRLVWVVNPQQHTIRVYRSHGPSNNLSENDILEGEDLLPGFRCRVGDLFLAPPGVEKTA